MVPALEPVGKFVYAKVALSFTPSKLNVPKLFVELNVGVLTRVALFLVSVKSTHAVPEPEYDFELAGSTAKTKPFVGIFGE